MPKFTAHATVVGSKYLGEFEAATAEEAKEKAWKKAYVGLCHHCSGECEDPTIEEIHMEPSE